MTKSVSTIWGCFWKIRSNPSSGSLAAKISRPGCSSAVESNSRLPGLSSTITSETFGNSAGFSCIRFYLFEQPLHFRAKEGDVERLCYIRGKSGRQSAFAIALHRAGGKRHDGSICKSRISSQLRDDSETVQLGHLQVKQEKIDHIARRLLQSLLSVQCLNHVITETFEHGADQFQAGRAVFCYQNPLHVSPRPFSGSGAGVRDSGCGRIN